MLQFYRPRVHANHNSHARCEIMIGRDDSSLAHERRAAFSRRSSLRSLCGIGVLMLSQAVWPAAKGDVAPACAATTPDGALTVRVADYKGKVVYLDFWASWCGPCRESFPFMNELQREFGGKGLQILAVSVDKTPDDARRFLERFPPLFTVALDPKGTCASAYLVPGMPTTFVIDRAGIVRTVHIGFHGGAKAEIRRQLLELLDESK